MTSFEMELHIQSHGLNNLNPNQTLMEEQVTVVRIRTCVIKGTRERVDIKEQLHTGTIEGTYLSPGNKR